MRGKFAGRDLVSPGARVRSTSEAVRDHWLTALEDHIKGARVLDLFAGSGALGVEALSRGAARADFVENGPASLHALKANVAAFRVKNRTRIFRRDAIPFVEGHSESGGTAHAAAQWANQGRYPSCPIDPIEASRRERVKIGSVACSFRRIGRFEKI